MKKAILDTCRSQDVSTNQKWKIFKFFFVDLGLAVCDLCTDVIQAIIFIFSITTRNYGLVSIALLYYPALFLIATDLFKEKPDVKKFLVILVQFVFYPLLLPIEMLKHLKNLLNQQDSSSHGNGRLHHLIVLKGGLSSPAQLIFQSWMATTGALKIGFPSSNLKWVDWEGNTLSLTLVFPLSILTSCASVVKAVLWINTKHSGSNTFTSYLRLFPLFIFCTFFRLTSLTLSLTYLNDFAFITILVQLLSNFILIIMQEDVKKPSIFVTGVILLFMPYVRSQGQNFSVIIQTIISLFIQSLSLSACMIIINSSYDLIPFKYSPDSVFNGFQANFFISSTIISGVVSVFLAILHHFQGENSFKQLPYLLSTTTLLWIGLIVFALVSQRTHYSYLTFRLAHNHTVTVKVIPLNTRKFCFGPDATFNTISTSQLDLLADAAELPRLVVVLPNGTFRPAGSQKNLKRIAKLVNSSVVLATDEDKEFLRGLPISLSNNPFDRIEKSSWSCSTSCKEIQIGMVLPFSNIAAVGIKKTFEKLKKIDYIFQVTQSGEIIGKAYRSSTCFWLGKPCFGTSLSSIQSSSSCDMDPKLQVCEDQFGPYSPTVAGFFQRSSPVFFCMKYSSKVRHNCSKVWTQWLPWSSDVRDGNQETVSRKRFCNEGDCLIEEKEEETRQIKC